MSKPIAKKKKKSYYPFIFVTLIAVVLGGGYYYFNQPKTESTTQTTEASVSQGDLIIGIDSDGTATLPYNSFDFEVSGKLKTINVVEGSTFKKGDQLATLDDSEYQKAYTSAKMAYDKAVLSYQSKVESQKLSMQTEGDKVLGLKLSYEQLKADYNAMIAISESYTQSDLNAKKKQMEDAKRAYELANQQHQVNLVSYYALDMEKLNVESARIQLQTAKENMSKTILVASEPGTVLKIGSKVGKNISPMNAASSLNASTSNLIVYTTGKQFEVSTSISEQDLTNIKLGQVVKVTFDALEGTVFEGKVTFIDTLPTTDSSGVVTYAVKATLKSGYDQLKVGMTASMQFVIKEQSQAMIIPNKAVFVENGKQYVQVKLQDGTIEKRQIKAGLTDGRNVAVSEGLNAGETVIITTVKKAE